MKLEKLVAECYDALAENIKESVCEDLKTACATVDTNDGYIDVCCDNDNDVNVLVYSDNKDKENNFPNLEAFLTSKLKDMVDWCQIEEETLEERDSYDEWNEHGFADASDYYNWRYNK